MKLLIVDDDIGLAQMLRNSLMAKAYSVDLAHDGGEGSFMGKMYSYDAILLDYSLPKKDGLAICKDIRGAGKTTPIIFLSVIDSTDTKITALDHGADDYLVKPFSFEELQARLRALHRRPAISKKPLLAVGDVTLDQQTQQVCRGDRTISLTRKEYGVLEYLMLHHDVIVSRTLIMEHVWTADNDLLSNIVETHIRNIRRKLNVGHTRDLIRNIPGRGYIMSAL